MSDLTRKYVDHDGLKLFHELSKTETETAINIAGAVLDTKIAVVDLKAQKAVDDLKDMTVTYNLYYVVDSGSTTEPIFIYQEAESPATTDYIYYTRTGSGTTQDPYVYTECDPQPAEGTEFPAGTYYRRTETINNTGYPAKDQEGNSKTETTLIITPTDTNTISEDDVADLFNTVETPIIVCSSGSYISITSATEGAVIYYTLDGSTPTKASTRYTGTITGSALPTSSCTVKAFGTKAGWISSPVASAEYTIGG